MKTKGLLSSLCVGVLLAGCNANINSNGQYKFNVGNNFNNQIFSYKRPEPPHFEVDYITQEKEEPYGQYRKIDVSQFNEGAIYTICYPGTYLLTGRATNSSIKVNTTGEVNLIFDNFNLASIGDTPIDIINAKKVNIKLLSKTKNYICDSRTNDNKAAIYANCPLEIEGPGFLYLNSYGRDQKAKEITYYGRCIFTPYDLTVTNARIIIGLSTGVTIESLGNITFTNSKYEAKFSFGGGIKATGNINFNNSLFIYNGYMNAIEGEILDFRTSNFYVLTIGKYEKVNKTLEELDPNKVYYAKDDSNYFRVNLDTFGGKQTLYTLVDPSKAIVANNFSEFFDCNFILDTDDDSIASNGTITSKDNNYYIKSTNQGIVTKDSIVLDSTQNDTSLKIFDSYRGVAAKNITFNGGINYISSRQSAIETLDEPSNNQNLEPFISLEENTNLMVNTDVYGLISDGELAVNDSFISIFGGTEETAKTLTFSKEASLNNSTLVTISDKNEDVLLSSGGEKSINSRFAKPLEKDEVLHLEGSSFSTSLIIPKAYEQIVVSMTSDQIKNGKYIISKDGFVDYQFINNIAFNGKPDDTQELHSFEINDDQDSYSFKF